MVLVLAFSYTLPHKFLKQIENMLYHILIGIVISKNNKKEGPYKHMVYRTRAIITRGLYIFYPLFEGQKRFFKEVFSENSAFMYG